MNKIIPGIYQLQVPIPNNPLGHTNVYLVQGDDECLLVDAGWDGEEELQSLKTRGALVCLSEPLSGGREKSTGQVLQLVLHLLEVSFESRFGAIIG